jgi:hypothetical protein
LFTQLEDQILGRRFDASVKRLKTVLTDMQANTLLVISAKIDPKVSRVFSYVLFGSSGYGYSGLTDPLIRVPIDDDSSNGCGGIMVPEGGIVVY